LIHDADVGVKWADNSLTSAVNVEWIDRVLALAKPNQAKDARREHALAIFHGMDI
jgi:hypothetical protein